MPPRASRGTTAQMWQTGPAGWASYPRAGGTCEWSQRGSVEGWSTDRKVERRVKASQESDVMMTILIVG